MKKVLEYVDQYDAKGYNCAETVLFACKDAREAGTERMCVRIGEGKKTMVMIPGLSFKSTLDAAPAVAAMYREVFKDYSIYLFDDRSRIREGYSIRQRAADIAAEMNRLGLQDACVFGVSMGGMTAQYLAIDHPELVKKLVLSATAPYLVEAASQVIGRWNRLAESGEVKLLVEESIRDIYSERTIRGFGAAIVEGIGTLSEKEVRDFVLLTKAILAFDSRTELGKITCPVKVIGAEGDRVLFKEGAKKLSEALSCECELYGEAYGHAVYDEAPDHKEKILEFFER